MTQEDLTGFISRAPRESCRILLEALREMIFTLSEDCHTDSISDDGSFNEYMAAQAIDEAQSLLSAANTLEAEYNGRRNNPERDQGARP